MTLHFLQREGTYGLAGRPWIFDGNAREATPLSQW
jgi:hypothetical protein